MAVCGDSSDFAAEGGCSWRLMGGGVLLSTPQRLGRPLPIRTELPHLSFVSKLRTFSRGDRLLVLVALLVLVTLGGTDFPLGGLQVCSRNQRKRASQGQCPLASSPRTVFTERKIKTPS